MKMKISMRSRVAAALVLFFGLGVSAAHAQSCTLSSTNPSVTICTPAANATLTSPVNVTAGTTDSHSITNMQIWLDGAKVYQVAAKSLNTNLNMSPGSHRLTVLAQDSAGATFKQTIYITVSTGNPSPCTLNTANPSVTICSPANNATVTSPVNVS